jgi:hypothetical protein
MRGKDMFTDMAIEELRGQIEHFCGPGDRVIDQARRRVLFGEQVATDEKIYSIFEPHTDLIKRGKVRTPVEFGHEVFLAESARRGPRGVFPPASPASAIRGAERQSAPWPQRRGRATKFIGNADTPYFVDRENSNEMP